ncbi:LUD domain-containing protein [Bradyrhizobium sp. BR13661]|jgi:L-lactate dehydrogenase complex protein LldG|uniref:LutC/YkgG family protein n=1 Tax=Bradyrhizobium sp. BR13661 TaxID=2940622 RepID=UPI002474E970|nr:LUD domain-containing protein [Bradyrhizobium sp. BR13661]MDH6257519.1 L-lactate dehydrogenase complex protein LldG [Bradyrhizobium sp. BR13661]
MSVRDNILEAVRAGLGTRSVDAAQVGRDAAALLADLPSIRPILASADLPAVFAARATTPKVAATVDRIGSAVDLPGAVRRYLDACGLRPAIALQPAAELRALDWTGFELHPSVASDEAVVVGVACWGIAETGSLVFHSGAETPILANFLPLHHLVLLHARTIVAHLEDYAAAAAGERAPRNVNIITGASGTTDIEGSLVLGAHGPKYLHIVLATP